MTADTLPAGRLEAAMHRYMRYHLCHVNPVLHRTTYYRRTFSELEIIVVNALGVVGSARPSELSRGLAIDKGTMTSVLRRLTDEGLLARQQIPTDARGYRVSLTRAGEGLRDHLDAQYRRGFRELFDDLDPDDVEAAVRGLDVLTEHLRLREEAGR